MSVAISGCTGLFSILQETFCHEEKSQNRIRLSSTMHGFLNDFRWLTQNLVLRPTQIAELIPDQELVINDACDVAAAGMRDVHYVPTNITEIPILWRQPFPDWIQTQLSSFKNPTGKITNSDLELAGSIAQDDILAQAFDGFRTIQLSWLLSCLLLLTNLLRREKLLQT